MSKANDNDGGAAFPIPMSQIHEMSPNSQIDYGERRGMSLRDYFAEVRRLIGLCASDGSRSAELGSARGETGSADAMIDRRRVAARLFKSQSGPT